MGEIEIIATLLGIAYVVLLIRENIWCWLAGNLSVILIAYSCYYANLYADMALQLFYFGAGVYGFVHWKWGVASNTEGTALGVGIRNLKGPEGLAYLVALLIGWGIAFLTVSQFRTAALADIDSLLFAASLVATLLQARKLLENWLLWIPINISYVFVYQMRHLEAYSVLSVLYAGLSAYGWFQWSKQLKTAQTEQAERSKDS